MTEPEEAVEIAALSAEIAACRLCRDAPAKGPGERLPHEPRPVAVISPTARILIAGQAPGLRVHESGLPFNDASGDRLRDWLDVTREEFYDPEKFAIVPMGFCFPGYDAHGSDLPPRRECAPLWHAPLLAQMENLKLTLLVGQYAQAAYLPRAMRPSLTAAVRAHAQAPQDRFPLPHPAWRSRLWMAKHPWFASEVLPELRQRVAEALG